RIQGFGPTAVDSKRNRSGQKRLNRTFETLIEGNSALVGSYTETTLLNKMCRVIADLGKYPFVWVGYPEHDRHKRIRPVVQAGEGRGYLESVDLTWSCLKTNKDPVGTALQTGNIGLDNNLGKMNGLIPWKIEASKRGFNSSLAFPLIRDDKTLGALNIFSADPEAFDSEEVILLSALADDLAYGIEAIHNREMKKKVEDELRESQERIRRTIEITVRALATTIEMRDPYTAGHQRRVAKLASDIAEEMGLTQDRVDNVKIAGIIHDIGKIYVPVEILTRPGKLSDCEINIIKAHPKYGHDIMSETEVPQPIADIVMQHHERVNGSGYPDGKKGQDILLESRILSVADVVEAMSSHRPYRSALGVDVALKEIENFTGIYFDPAVAEACLSLFKKKGYKLEQDSDASRSN
ncbi:HD domain-containing phosphohydrolase, partial [Acidobacteriota bacterium]